MNAFIEEIVNQLRDVDIYSVLVKGQGVAQCYERPSWRSSGDIDLLLDKDNYENAKRYLLPLANSSEKENLSVKHLGMSFDPWFLELHGTFRNRWLKQMNEGLDEVLDSIFYYGDIRVWRNGDTDIFLPSPDADAILIFSHILQHLFQGGVGLRQICDWTRVLYTYRSILDTNLLEHRLRRMKTMTEWKAFGCLIVKYLGYDKDAFPFYDSKYEWKADLLEQFVIEKGNFGQNVDNSYQENNTVIVRKTISLMRVIKDSLKLFILFPLDSFKSFVSFIIRKREK